MDEKRSKWFYTLDERQQKEVLLSELYASNFAHGTNGHNQYMLIAKLARILDKAEENFPNDSDIERWLSIVIAPE